MPPGWISAEEGLLVVDADEEGGRSEGGALEGEAEGGEKLSEVGGVADEAVGAAGHQGTAGGENGEAAAEGRQRSGGEEAAPGEEAVAEGGREERRAETGGEGDEGRCGEGRKGAQECTPRAFTRRLAAEEESGHDRAEEGRAEERPAVLLNASKDAPDRERGREAGPEQVEVGGTVNLSI
jgi:hypothetical protein